MSKVALPVLCLSFLFLLASAAKGEALYRRDLSCERWTNAREREICKALEREMEWTWTGHAILSPSFRVTFQTVKGVFCSLPITSRDTSSLVAIFVALERRPGGTMASLQLTNGSRFLLNLLGDEALKTFPVRDKTWDDPAWQIARNLREDTARDSADPGMIWNKANPQYLLRNGCE